MSMQYVKRLAACGLCSPADFERELDMGNYIGFRNGVYDVLHDRFMPRGRVPLNVLVSMCTQYDYVAPDDARVSAKRAEIEAFYRTLHAENYDDPNDERREAQLWDHRLRGSGHCHANKPTKTGVLKNRLAVSHPAQVSSSNSSVSRGFKNIFHLTLIPPSGRQSPRCWCDRRGRPHPPRWHFPGIDRSTPDGWAPQPPLPPCSG